MNAHTLRQLYVTFFQEHGHAAIGGASLIPEHDPSVLFTTAGMHPLVPFLLGEPHPAGNRLVNVQKCLRTDDIVEVGDDVHLTFFEMLGNWSLGDYWKEEAIRLSYTFLIERLAIDAGRLYVTCFAGDDDAPRDGETADIWRSLGIPESRLTFLPKKDNWWGPAGQVGPCGPDSEMFYDTTPGGPSGETPATAPQRFCEIWNDVFMQYDKKADGRFSRLAQRNVDTGMGLERVLAILEGKPSLYETELFEPLLERIRSLAAQRNQFAERIVADHIRSAAFILAEGIKPGNLDQPYIARRLIRRAVRYGHDLGISGHFMAELSAIVAQTMGDVYPELLVQGDAIALALDEEESQFERTLQRGEAEFHKAVEGIRAAQRTTLPGKTIFRLYDTYGFPPELTQELAAGEELAVDMEGYHRAFAKHQQQSRQGAESRFRGGLAERSPETIKLHTATHLLHAALRHVLGEHVEQRGSNITPERLRFDFTHGAKMTPEEIERVEVIVNEQIDHDLAITWQEMQLEEAQASGALGLFQSRYGERVKVYRIGDFSQEICGGPHVDHTSELGHLHILKEQSIGSGLRRIRARLEPAKESKIDPLGT